MDHVSDLCSAEGAFTVLVTVIILYAVFHLFHRNAKRLPRGPFGIPFVGNLLFFSKKAQVKLLELRKKYGPIYSVKVGSNDMVVLCDYQSVRQALLQDAFSGIAPTWDTNSQQSGSYDAAKIASEWTEQSRFLYHLLKDLGFGRSKMEEHVKEEICCVLDIIEEHAGQSLMMSTIIAPSASNNIASMLFGRRMAYDDPKNILLHQLLKDYNTLSGQMAIASCFPWLLPLMRSLRIGNLHKLDEINAKMNEFFNNEIEEHERTLDAENIRDFIDGFLVEMEKTRGQQKTMFTKSYLQEIVKGFFAAGTDTVRFTLDWLLLTVAAFTDVQARVQEEVDEVVGRERFPEYKDRSKMPFTQAVMMEIMRWRNVFPLNYFRYTTKDAEVSSVFIPKHTNILVNTWSVTHDPALWGHPDSFRPERFLANNGKGVRKPEYFFPFSIGKRACPGESFASIEVFLYFTAILQKFNIFPPEGTGIDLEGDLRLSLQPRPQKIVFKRRE